MYIYIHNISTLNKSLLVDIDIIDIFIYNIIFKYVLFANPYRCVQDEV